MQYNTCYWALVHDGCTGAEAQQMLKVCSPLAALYWMCGYLHMCHTYTRKAALCSWSQMQSTHCSLHGRAHRQASKISCCSRGLASTTMIYCLSSRRWG